ncbi:hypothetical protein DPMN_062189 [Dreissena polymorpha]|uniref:Uncharacterized protein n=1 Tax=Dreissena polymorpha TaxID=45954 RepID=A0A9D4HHW7_DREPO|nr:hypothetical protein DPMN_062189 [Dreissena polymorpha]
MPRPLAAKFFKQRLPFLNSSKTNLLSKFHEDPKINVASRVLTRFYYSHIRKNAPPPGVHVFKPTSIIFEHVQDIIGMNLLTKFLTLCSGELKTCSFDKHEESPNQQTK